MRGDALEPVRAVLLYKGQGPSTVSEGQVGIAADSQGNLQVIRPGASPMPSGISYQNGAGVAVRPHVWTGSAVTVAGGTATFVLPQGFFTAVHGAWPSVVRDTSTITTASFAMVRSRTASQVVVQVTESKTTGVLIGGNVEGLEFAPAGVTVDLLVFGV